MLRRGPGGWAQYPQAFLGFCFSKQVEGLVGCLVKVEEIWGGFMVLHPWLQAVNGYEEAGSHFSKV